MRGVVLAVLAGVVEGRYFAFYDDDVGVTGAYTNLHFAGTAADAVKANAEYGQDVLLSSQAAFLHGVSGEGLRLRDDWNVSWPAFAAEVAPLLTNGSIIGFNLGDELVWNCLPPAQLLTMSSAVRARFPKAYLWYNEATGPVETGIDFCGTKHSDYSIPPELDLFSIDMYHMSGTVQGWVKTYVEAFYEKYIFPHLHQGQKVAVVPGSFGSDVNHYPNGTYVCDRDCYDKMCAHDAQDFADWAVADDRIGGVFPWNWGGCPTCNGSRWTPPHTCCMDEIGTKDQPLARQKWFDLAKTIKG
eukprot:Hpha_TRINITY_DN30886_c0_g1::TRINITY_DN30886_c0_g1_i1::g.155622::m.155622